MSNTRKPRAAKPKPIDFDAVRKQRTKITRDMPPIKIAGKNYTLKPTMPLAVTDYFAENAKRGEDGNVTVLIEDMKGLLAELFGPEQWAEIRKDIDITDVAPLFNTVFKAYGESVGESSNSGQS